MLEKLLELRDLLAGRSAFLEARVEASIAYLRCSLGQPVDFATYIHDTMGFAAKPLPEHAIETQRLRVIELLAEVGLRLEAAAVDAFQARFVLSDPRDVESLLAAAIDRALPAVSSYLGVRQPPEIEIRNDRVDAYWKNWIRSDRHGKFVLTVNLHKRCQYYRGDPEILAYHEIGSHALHMAIWRDRIDRQEMHPAYGVTVVHSSEQFVAEGLAQTLSDLVEDRPPLSSFAELTQAYERYRQMIYYEAQLRVNRGETLRQVSADVRRDLPFERHDVVEAELHDRSLDPLFRTYQLVYAPSALYFRQHIVQLPHRERRELVRQIYRTPLTFRGLNELIQRRLPVSRRC